MKQRFIHVYLCLLVLTFNVNGQQQKNMDTNDEQGETIVIIGKIPRPISDVFGAATVISKQTMEKELVHDIADLVRYQAGINIENAGTRFGYSGFSIRGIGGNRVATEIDGVPVADQFNIGSYSNSGRNLIDIDLVQQVEILRGPSSSIYGSNAIGGVISFITKKPVDLISQSDTDSYVDLKTGYYGVDNSNLLSSSSAFADGASSLLVNLSFTKGEAFDSNTIANIATDTQHKSTQAFIAKYFYDVSVDQQLSISLDYYKKRSDTVVNSILGLGRFRNTTSLIGDDEQTRKNYTLGYEFNSESSWLKGGFIRVYQQNTDTEQLSDEARTSRGTNFLFDRDFFYEQKIDGVRFNFYTSLESENLSHQIGYGLEWSQRKVTELRNGLQNNLDNGTSTNIILSEQFPLRDFPISTIKESGLYINDEINIEGTGFSFIPALRFDRYQLNPSPDAIYLEDNPATAVVSIEQNNVSPKLGFQYEHDDQNRWFIQYFEGFRAPPFEDANIGLDIPLFNIRAIPNPDLKSESSRGYEAGYRYLGEQHQLELIGFTTTYDDFIQTKVNLGFDPTSGRVLFQSQNIDKAKIYGAEIQYKFNSSDWFMDSDNITVFANAFWSKGENQETNKPLNNIDPNHLFAGLNWQTPNQDVSIAFNASVYDSKSDIDKFTSSGDELFTTPGFSLFDLIVNYHFNQKITLSAAVYNLTDKRYWRWTDVNGLILGDPIINSLTASGINASLQLKIQW
jgi:hemoglobin/transferrin/lactoferrin receptor protein